MNDNNIFNPLRLKFARRWRGFTARNLSKRLGITDRTFSDYENGHAVPQPLLLNKLASVLEFPEEFFFADDISPIKDDAVSFRALSKMAAKVRDTTLHISQIAVELSEWIDERFETPSGPLPDLRHLTAPAAAETLRSMWMLGEMPIGNMIHLLESKGVRVFSLPVDSLDTDACSFWKDDRPFILLNTKKTAEKSRFDAAHELGHLVLHKHGGIGKIAEMQANDFASSFLMTEGSVRANFRICPTIDKIIADKCFWKVSAVAYARRLKDLLLITDWQYRTFCIELSKRVGRKREINPISQRETSKFLPAIFQALREEGITKHNIAKDLNIYSKDIDALIFNLIILSLPGGIKETSRKPINHGYLKLVK